jgi:hypothetical protein
MMFSFSCMAGCNDAAIDANAGFAAGSPRGRSQITIGLRLLSQPFICQPLVKLKAGKMEMKPSPTARGKFIITSKPEKGQIQITKVT